MTCFSPMKPSQVSCLKSTGTKNILALVVLAAGILSSLAADVQWDDGAGNNDWNNPTNWAGNVLPLATDNAHINLAGANRAVFSTGTSSYNLIRVGDSATGE